MAETYLYNGVELPELPEWDRETYPYASIRYDGTQFWVHAQTQAEKIVRYDDVFGYVYMVESYTTGKQWSLDDSGTWKLWDIIYGIKADTECYSYQKTTEDYAVWTNYDVIWADTGDIFFAASDPVPVVRSIPVLMPASMFQGLRVGRMIARQRAADGSAVWAFMQGDTLILRAADSVVQTGDLLEVR